MVEVFRLCESSLYECIERYNYLMLLHDRHRDENQEFCIRELILCEPLAGQDKKIFYQDICHKDIDVRCIQDDFACEVSNDACEEIL